MRVDPGDRVKLPAAGLPAMSTVARPAFAFCSTNVLKMEGGRLAFRPASPDLVDPKGAKNALPGR